MLNVLYLWGCRSMSEKRKNDTIIEGEYYDPDLPAQENTPPQKHRRTRSAGNVPKYNPASESIITKSNDLIQKTKYALPKLEQKVLLAMMAQINPKETPDADRVYSLSFSDFGRLAGVNMHDNTYLEYLKDTVKSLEDRSFWSLDPASDGHQYKVLSWLQRGSTVNDRDNRKPDLYRIARTDAVRQNQLRCQCLNVLLQVPFQRSCTVNRIVAIFNDEILCLVRQGNL